MIDPLDEYRAGLDTALAEIAHEIGPSDATAQAVRYAIEGGGKRLRPILCLAAMRAVSGQEPDRDACRAAAAIELIHTYSLVHDDLPCMDDDSLRRGRPTVHRVFDSTTAVLAGFALIPHACRVLDRAAEARGLDGTARSRLVRSLCHGAGASGMVGGQVLDLEGEGTDLEMAALRRVHGMKTGALFGAALRIGGLLGGATPVQEAALGAFGERLGVAFQIMDDVLDVTTEVSALGKTPGKDRDASKVTFVSLLGESGAHSAALAEVEAALGQLASADLATAELGALARLAVDRDR